MYKRQGNIRAGSSGIFCCKRGGLERTSDDGGGTSGNGNPAYGCIRTTAVEAVSYTHLDVYKRQAFIVSFTIVFVGLGLNLILSQVVFNGGTNTPFDAEPLKLSLIHI